MRRKTRRGPTAACKLFALAALVVQTTFTVLVMQYSRRTEAGEEGPRYAPSTAVTTAEFLKWITALVAVYFTQPSSGDTSDMGPVEYIYDRVYSDPWDYLKVSVPGICYMIQNNLLFLALSNLDSAVYQVVYQLKVLSTAIFSVTMLYDPVTGLRRTLSKRQWMALFLLMGGAGLAQISASDGANTELPDRSSYLGLGACLGACLLSGFSGVWFERILKPKPTESNRRKAPPSLWVRNVQLASFGVLSGVITVYVKDWDFIQKEGWFGGYTSSTWVAVISNTFGGFLVALVVKYTSQVTKAFANGLSILLGVICAVFLFDFHVTSTFGLGAMLVLVALAIFNSKKKKTVR